VIDAAVELSKRWLQLNQYELLVQ